MRPRYFIVRVYRFGGHIAEALEGTVERVPRGAPVPFETLEELWSILAGKGKARGGAGAIRNPTNHPFEDEGD